MDSITQIVLGAAVSEATIGEKEGNKALLWGAIIGTVPDLDVIFIPFFNTVKGLFVHRGFSHSILFAILISPLIGWLLSKIYEKSATSTRRWMLMSFLVIGTHILLDLFTNYGTGLFVPFNNYRVEWGTIAIIDVFYTVPFLLSLVILMFFNRTSKTRRFISWSGIVVSTLYLMFTVGNKFNINSTFKNELVSQHIHYERFKSVPLPLTNFLWMGIAEVENKYLIGYYSVFDDSKQIEFSAVKKNELLIYPLLREKMIKDLIRFTKGFYTVNFTKGKLILNDLRFGRMGISEGSPFIFSFEIQKQGNVLQVSEAQHPRNEGEDMFAGYFKRIFGDRN